MTTPILYQFDFSHFNEKARWVLDYKGIAHQRRSLLPGPHVPVMLALSGQTATPVIKHGDRVITGSAKIIDELEKDHPDPPLYPSEPKQRREALEMQEWLDKKLGPDIRRAMFYDILVDPLYVSRVFSGGKNLSRFLYLVTYPCLATFLSFQQKITPARAEKARKTTREVLDFVATTAGQEGYLVGNNFSVADLTAAALLFLAVLPPEAGIPAMEPLSPVMKKWLARWQGHPGFEWVRTMYQRHRVPTKMAVA